MAQNINSDLDDLLNDALSDFDKKPTEVADHVLEDDVVEKPSSSRETAKITELPDDATGSSVKPPTEIFDQFFDKDISERLQHEWESAMKELVDDDPDLASQLKNLDLSQTLQNDTGTAPSPQSSSSNTAAAPQEPPPDLSKILEATISGIERSADELKNFTGSDADEDLLKEMRNMGMGGGLPDMMGQMGEMEGLEGNFISMMEGMMQNLLSKDVLYPTMKKISEIYPGWLETNKGKVPEGDYTRYERQNVIIGKICKNFESDNENDPKEIRRERLNELMSLVENMQECGNPPKELLDQCGGGTPMDPSQLFGAGGLSGMPNPGNMNPENCAIM